MRETGVRGVEGFERKKHGEVSGFAGRRNKGESEGGFAPGVWRNSGKGSRFQRLRWHQSNVHNRSGHSVFVDHLPVGVSKREIYKKFGKVGFILDVFISRKERRNGKGIFAFVRYYSLVGAEKAVKWINGLTWDGCILYATLSSDRREGEVSWRLR
ncbi:hypothetical protein PIB30_049189 [Stylosanthes scabra]|uniref:RRM domain-containing protein n=1 Tax=Stylosanthes scabra TaxID=79078 RepID=A0ABU6UJH3_9FABA|nr:hypothetical protein [Stylosanthes scabra]